MKVEEIFLICRVLFLKSFINALFHWLGFCGGCSRDGFSLLESRDCAGCGWKIILLPVFVGNVGGRFRMDIHGILKVVFRWFLLGF